LGDFELQCPSFTTLYMCSAHFLFGDFPILYLFYSKNTCIILGLCSKYENVRDCLHLVVVLSVLILDLTILWIILNKILKNKFRGEQVCIILSQSFWRIFVKCALFGDNNVCILLRPHCILFYSAFCTGFFTWRWWTFLLRYPS